MIIKSTSDTEIDPADFKTILHNYKFSYLEIKNIQDYLSYQIAVENALIKNPHDFLQDTNTPSNNFFHKLLTKDKIH